MDFLPPDEPEPRCALATSGESYTEQRDPTYHNLTQEDVDRYPVLAELVLADSYRSIEVGCEEMEEIWSYLHERGFVTTYNGSGTAWLRWQGEEQGIHQSRKIP